MAKLQLLDFIRVCLGFILLHQTHEIRPSLAKFAMFAKHDNEEPMHAEALKKLEVSSIFECQTRCLQYSNCNIIAFKPFSGGEVFNCWFLAEKESEFINFSNGWLTLKHFDTNWFQRLNKSKEIQTPDNGKRNATNPSKSSGTTEKPTTTYSEPSIMQALFNWCKDNIALEGPDASKKLYPVYGKGPTNSSFQWGCYLKDSLTSDLLYYSKGTGVFSRHREMENLILSHPTFNADKFYLSDAWISCSDRCLSEHLTCNPYVETLDSIWLFHYRGIPCNPNFDADDYFGVDYHPVYDPSNKLCFGFAKLPLNQPEYLPKCNRKVKNVKRLCRCS